MYPILIVTFLAASYLLLYAPNYNANSLANPNPFEQETEAYAASHGTDLALFAGGIQRFVAQYDYDPADVAFGEISAELLAGGGTWTIDWDDLGTFMGASVYATGFIPPLTRADLFPPNYAPSGPWNATFIEQVDPAGVGTGQLNAVIIWADMAVQPMVSMDRGSLLVGFDNALGNSVNGGIVQGGELAARGGYTAGVAFPGGVYTTHQNIPNAVPDGSVAFISCVFGDQPGPDLIPGTADDSADGFCE